ncbi:Crp/Fnr family transcriptional regulator [Pontixanthobacter sp.]|uniref:Crp/Fnr family transcriptional regulator n=1 Tax=Pontixanthobacter sp. TaxID=2792078 RepID=UPI003C7CB838
MDQSEHISVLQALLGCGPDDAEELYHNTRIVTEQPATTLAYQGDISSHCQFVISGAVALRALSEDGQYTQIATVEPGEIFGAFPFDAPHDVEVIAQDAVEMIVIGTAQIHALAQSRAAIGSGLAALFARQLSNVLGRMAARVTLTANGRVYQELLDQADPSGRITPAPVVTALGVKAQTARETASRAISKLQERGLLQKSKSHWTVTSLRMLEQEII